MAATEQSFAFGKGQDVTIDWTVRATDSDDAAVVDITGWTFAFKVKRTDADADPSLVTATSTIQSAGAGTVRVTIAAADMASLDGDYRFAFWRTNSGAAAPLGRGFFSVYDTVQS